MVCVLCDLGGRVCLFRYLLRTILYWGQRLGCEGKSVPAFLSMMLIQTVVIGIVTEEDHWSMKDKQTKI